MKAASRKIGMALLGAALILGFGAGVRAADQAVAAAPAAPTAPTSGGNLETVWQTQMLLGPNTRLTALWLCGDFLVGRGSDNYIYVVNAWTGVRLWADQVAEPFQTVWRPAVDKANLWFPTTTNLVGYAGNEGKRIDAIDLDFAPDGRSATNGTHCFIPDGKGWLQAVSIVPKVLSWGRWTEDTVTAGPVIDSAMVYFASQNGSVYASTQNVRRVVWEHPTEGPIVADLKQTRNGLVLAASLDYSLYAFAGPSGRLVWRYNAGEPLRRSPYAYNKQAFLLTQEAGLTAIDLTNGHAQWSILEGNDVVGANADTLYGLSRQGDLLALNRADGTLQFSLPLKRGLLAAMNEKENGIVYLATSDGQVMALGKKADCEALAKKEEPLPPPTTTKKVTPPPPTISVTKEPSATPAVTTPAPKPPATPRPPRARPTPTPPPAPPPPPPPPAGGKKKKK